MPTYSKVHLSANATGRPIKVVATATTGTTIHAGHATDKDEVWLWASNTDTTARKLTVEFGGTTSPDDLIEVTLAPESGLVPIIPGICITNVTITAFAATANVINIVGYVNRITP